MRDTSLALTVHGQGGVVDLLVPREASAQDIAREYAAQCRLTFVPALHTRGGRSLDPGESLSDVGLAYLSQGTLERANARVAPRMWLHSALCFALAVFFHDNTPALWGCLAAYTAFYVSQYRALVRFRGKGVRRWAATAHKGTTRVKRDGVRPHA